MRRFWICLFVGAVLLNNFQAQVAHAKVRERRGASKAKTTSVIESTRNAQRFEANTSVAATVGNLIFEDDDWCWTKPRRIRRPPPKVPELLEGLDFHFTPGQN